MCWFLKTSSSHSSSSQSDSSPWKRRVLKWNLEENFFYESFCFDFSWNTSKHKYRTFRDLAGSKPAMIPTPSFFSTTCLQEKCDGDEGKCCLWYICEFVSIHPTIEWTHCGGGILFGISDDLSKTQLKCCPPLKYFVNPTFSLEQPSSSFSLSSPLPL